MNKLHVIFVSVLAVFNVITAVAQGCSDAGACSIAGHFTEEKITGVRFGGFVSQSVALGEQFVFISQTDIGADVRFPSATTLAFQVPFVAVYGNLGFNSGMGDGIFSIRQQIVNGRVPLQMIGAVRLRGGLANAESNGNPLPMAYQTGTGTYDIIAAALLTRDKWDFYLAWQHPFGRNANGYLHRPEADDPYNDYFESAELKRGDDLVFRVQKAFLFKQKNLVTAALMPIYRLQRDEIIKGGVPVTLNGSNGLTLNVNLKFTKTLLNGGRLQWLIAFPVIDRRYRADGLTRNIVLSIRYRP